MSARATFTDDELAFLRDGPRLGRIATVDRAGQPHVVPVGWRYNADLRTIEVGGRDLPPTKKFRNVRDTGRVAFVLDDLVSVQPWRPRFLMVQGRGEAIDATDDGTPVIRIWPQRIASAGLARRPDSPGS